MQHENFPTQSREQLPDEPLMTGQEPTVVKAYKERLRKEGWCEYNAEQLLEELFQGLERVSASDIDDFAYDALNCVVQEARQSLVPLTLWLEETEWDNELWCLDDLLDAGFISSEEIDKYRIPLVHRTTIYRVRLRGIGWFIQGLYESYCTYLLDNGYEQKLARLRGLIVKCEHGEHG